MTSMTEKKKKIKYSSREILLPKNVNGCFVRWVKKSPRSFQKMLRGPLHVVRRTLQPEWQVAFMKIFPSEPEHFSYSYGLPTASRALLFNLRGPYMSPPLGSLLILSRLSFQQNSEELCGVSISRENEMRSCANPRRFIIKGCTIQSNAENTFNTNRVVPGENCFVRGYGGLAWRNDW